MMLRLLRLMVTLCLAVPVLLGAAFALDLEFKTATHARMGRIDAIAYLGKGVVVSGSRGGNSTGYLFVSKDFGATWRKVGGITDGDFITCLQSGGNGAGYLLTGRDVHVWKTTDYGETWTDLGQVSRARSGNGFANAYGMVVTSRGTVLVADGDGNGGHIHRSIDGGKSWQDLGGISPKPLYRLNEIKDGVIANGWAGNVYKSSDDGATWKDMGHLSPSALYAIEHLEEDGMVLIGTEDGHVFRSKDNCKTWQDVGKVGDAADDFAWLGGGRVLYSTYTGDRSLYLSADSGASWRKIGTVPTEPNDWLDHFICIPDAGVRHLVGGTNKGYLIHSRIPE